MKSCGDDYDDDDNNDKNNNKNIANIYWTLFLQGINLNTLYLFIPHNPKR